MPKGKSLGFRCVEASQPDQRRGSSCRRSRHRAANGYILLSWRFVEPNQCFADAHHTEYINIPILLVLI